MNLLKAVCMSIVVLGSMGLVGCGNNAKFSQPEILEKSQPLIFEEEEFYEITSCDNFQFEGFQFKAESISLILDTEESSYQVTFAMDQMVDSRDLESGMKMFLTEGVQYNQIRINVNLEESFLWGEGFALKEFKYASLANTGIKMHFDEVQETAPTGMVMQMSAEQIQGSYRSNRNHCMFKPNFQM